MGQEGDVGVDMLEGGLMPGAGLSLPTSGAGSLKGTRRDSASSPPPISWPTVAKTSNTLNSAPLKR